MSQCPFWSVGGEDCVRFEQNLQWWPPLICGTCPSAHKEPADCETSFSKLTQSPQRRFTILSRGEVLLKNTFQKSFRTVTSIFDRIATVPIPDTAFVSAVMYDNQCRLRCCRSTMILFMSFLFSKPFLRGYNMPIFVMLSKHFHLKMNAVCQCEYS